MGIVYIFNFSRELKPFHCVLRYDVLFIFDNPDLEMVSLVVGCPLTGSVMPTLKGSPLSVCEFVSNFGCITSGRIYLLTPLAIVTFKSYSVALVHICQKIHHVSTL